MVNDSLGLEAGDELLTTAARRLDGVLRAGDRLARVGGDELAVVCRNVRHVDDVLALARRLRAVFDQPLSLGDDEVYLDASVGVIVSDGPHDTPARLLRDADVAVFAAKELGRGRVELFDDTMRDQAVRRLEIESSLRRALVRGEFRVHYQPLVAIASSEMVGLEALLRWEHPDLGVLGPADFLEIAEETGLIVPIGAWVLHEACSQTARWCAERPHESPLTIAVNVSARQLNDPELVSIVDSVLAATRLDPSLLTLEINETVLVENREQSADVLRQLAARGVRIAIDDFGTGQSSLAHLNVLPVHATRVMVNYQYRFHPMLDLGVGAGTIVFSGDDFANQTHPVLTPLTMTFTPLGFIKGDKEKWGRVLRLKYSERYILGDIRAQDFHSVVSKYVKNGEWNTGISLSLDVWPFLVRR